MVVFCVLLWKIRFIIRSVVIKGEKLWGSENQVYLKGQSPDITKKEDVTTVDIGETIHYTITGTIPDTTGYKDYYYLIEDTLTAGLDYDGNVTVEIKNPEGTPTKAPGATITGRTFKLDLSEWVRKNQENVGKEFTVTYNAIVNENAVVTENNQAYLEYGDNPENVVRTTPREVKVQRIHYRSRKQIVEKPTC